MKNYQLAYLLLFCIILAISCDRPKGTTASKSTVEDSLIAKGDDADLDAKLRSNYLDSVFQMASARNVDTTTQRLLRDITRSYYNQNLYKEAISSGKKLLSVSRSLKDTLLTGRALFYIGESFYGLGNNDSAFIYYRRAENNYKDFKVDDRTLGEIILYKAYIYYEAGVYVRCEGEAFRALKLLRTEKNPSDLYVCYNLIASALDGEDNNEEAIRYFQLALDELDDDYKKEGYTDGDIVYNKAICYNNMGNAYLKMDNYEKAIEFYNKILKIPEIKQRANLYSRVLNSLASAKYKSGDQSGLPGLFYKSLRIKDSLGDQQGVIAGNVTLGEYSLYKKDTLKAIQYLRKAYVKAKEEKSNYDLLASLRILVKIDKKNNDHYYTRYVTVNDSLQQIAENTRNRFAKVEYDTDMIITEKEALAKKNSFIIGVSIVVVLFIAAIFIIYYLNSKNKELLLVQEQQKANEEIYELMFEQQGKIESARTEEKSRIAMELHDGILNNIYAVRLNLEFINKKADEDSIIRRKEYIKELQAIESEIRGVSHDLNRNALFNQEQSFENMLGFMITSQKNTFDTEFEADIDPAVEWESMSNVCKVNVYRIIQEALQNVNKYSNAKHAKVTISRDDTNVAISIIDDGVGFVAEKAKGGIGLRNLKKRADALNGILEVKSEPGNGAEIGVLFPL